jgi:hypothetical protein
MFLPSIVIVALGVPGTPVISPALDCVDIARAGADVAPLSDLHPDTCPSNNATPAAMDNPNAFALFVIFISSQFLS